MGAPASTAAIFDLDGTLFDGHVWMAVAEYHKRRRVNRRWFYAYVAVHMPLWYIHKLGLMSGDRARYLWARNMAWSLRGFDQAQATAMFEWIADKYIIPLLRPEVVQRLRHHQAQGDHIVILSGAFEGLLSVVGQRLGVNHVLGTRLVTSNGRYVGRALAPICHGQGKVQRLQAYLAGPGKGIDLHASYAYADSLTDWPVLQMVGHPFAVHPDEELAALVGRRGWPILDATSSSSD